MVQAGSAGLISVPSGNGPLGWAPATVTKTVWSITVTETSEFVTLRGCL